MRSPISFHSHHTRFVAVLVGQFLTIAVLTLLLYAFGPRFVPLWYSLVEPSEQLAPKLHVVSIPAIGAAILLITLWYGRRTKLEHEEYLATIALWSGNILLLLLAIALLRIMKVIL